MQLTRTLGTFASFAAFVAAIMLSTTHPARSTDLQDSQTLVNHPAVDITDVYAFPAPDSTNNVVLVMDTNPLIPSGQGGATAFDPNVLYQFNISHGSSGVADTVIQFVANVAGTGQKLTMYGPAAPNANSPSVSTVVPVTASGPIPYTNSSTTTTITVPDASGSNPQAIKAFAGPRADPEFFDLSRFYSIFPDENYANHQTTSALPAPSPSPITFAGFTAPTACGTTPSTNYFATGNYNVLSIVLEVPKTWLAKSPANTSQNTLSIWATTSTVTGS